MSDAPALVFVDTETTHLDPEQGEVYEIALTKTTDDGAREEEKDFWIEPLRLQQASSSALQVGRFYERHPKPDSSERRAPLAVAEEGRHEVAVEIATFTEGCHLVGAKPDFDAAFITAFLRANGACPAWHHRLIDVESLAIGLIVRDAETWGRPQSLSDICKALDIKREGHEARGDCDAVRAVYFKLMEIADQRYQLWRGAVREEIGLGQKG